MQSGEKYLDVLTLGSADDTCHCVAPLLRYEQLVAIITYSQVVAFFVQHAGWLLHANLAGRVWLLFCTCRFW